MHKSENEELLYESSDKRSDDLDDLRENIVTDEENNAGLGLKPAYPNQRTTAAPLHPEYLVWENYHSGDMRCTENEFIRKPGIKVNIDNPNDPYVQDQNF